MACEWDPDTSDDQAVELISNDRDTWVRMWNHVDPWDGHVVQICIEVGTDDMRAVTHGVTRAVAGDTLTSFLDHLAERFAGWEGTLNWHGMEPGLKIDATHHTGGHVVLTFTIGPACYTAAWSVSVRVVVDAGEQLRRLTGDVSRFLNSAT
jgi:hypothetical protein